MNEPSKGAVEFATRIYVQMFGHVSTDDADVNRMVVLAIAFDSCAAASRDAVLAEREACAKIADEEADHPDGDSAACAAERIRARGTK
jgi:hypothetical protein